MNKKFILVCNSSGMRVHHGGKNMLAGAGNVEITSSNEKMKQREQIGSGMRLKTLKACHQ